MSSGLRKGTNVNFRKFFIPDRNSFVKSGDVLNFLRVQIWGLSKRNYLRLEVRKMTSIDKNIISRASHVENAQSDDGSCSPHIPT